MKKKNRKQRETVEPEEAFECRMFTKQHVPQVPNDISCRQFIINIRCCYSLTPNNVICGSFEEIVIL